MSGPADIGNRRLCREDSWRAPFAWMSRENPVHFHEASPSERVRRVIPRNARRRRQVVIRA
jgi:hypothetical protein